MIEGQFALVVATLFAGAALYITLVEQPARLKLDDRALLAEWNPAYKRGFAMQASLAIVGFLLGVFAWRETGDWGWVTGAAILIANWPYTLIFMMRTNRRLMALDPRHAGPETRMLMKKWGSLHSVRSALGCASVAVFFQASIG